MIQETKTFALFVVAAMLLLCCTAVAYFSLPLGIICYVLWVAWIAGEYEDLGFYDKR